MSKRNLIIAVLVVGILLGAAGIVYLLTSKNSQISNPTPAQNQQPSSYFVSLNAVDQNVSGQINYNGKTLQLNSTADIDQYGLVSFNSAGDLMWFQCSQGYSITALSSSTSNQHSQVDQQAYIVLTPGQSSNLSATCTKQ